MTVRRYFCRRLLGLSERVYSMSPSSNKVFMARLNAPVLLRRLRWAMNSLAKRGTDTSVRSIDSDWTPERVFDWARGAASRIICSMNTSYEINSAAQAASLLPARCGPATPEPAHHVPHLRQRCLITTGSNRNARACRSRSGRPASSAPRPLSQQQLSRRSLPAARFPPQRPSAVFLLRPGQERVRRCAAPLSAKRCDQYRHSPRYPADRFARSHEPGAIEPCLPPV